MERTGFLFCRKTQTCPAETLLARGSILAAIPRNTERRHSAASCRPGSSLWHEFEKSRSWLCSCRTRM